MAKRRGSSTSAEGAARSGAPSGIPERSAESSHQPVAKQRWGSFPGSSSRKDHRVPRLQRPAVGCGPGSSQGGQVGWGGAVRVPAKELVLRDEGGEALVHLPLHRRLDIGEGGLALGEGRKRRELPRGDLAPHVHMLFATTAVRTCVATAISMCMIIILMISIIILVIITTITHVIIAITTTSTISIITIIIIISITTTIIIIIILHHQQHHHYNNPHHHDDRYHYRRYHVNQQHHVVPHAHRQYVYPYCHHSHDWHACQHVQVYHTSHPKYDDAYCNY